jgi:hypothetical protein
VFEVQQDERGLDDRADPPLTQADQLQRREGPLHKALARLATSRIPRMTLTMYRLAGCSHFRPMVCWGDGPQLANAGAVLSQMFGTSASRLNQR